MHGVMQLCSFLYRIKWRCYAVMQLPVPRYFDSELVDLDAEEEEKGKRKGNQPTKKGGEGKEEDDRREGKERGRGQYKIEM
jgi:hypothetical protein